MTYALLSEVWGDLDLKRPKKSKKKKKKVSFQDQGEGPNGPLSPMTPQEMETELLDDDGSQERNMRHMKATPYSPEGPEYQHLSQESYRMPNEHRLPYSQPLRRVGGQSGQVGQSPPVNQMANHADDPLYQEFLDYRNSRNSKNQQGSSSLSLSSLNPLTGQGEQFNELLLYMFTGFFLLMLYDNIYKLGRDAY
jgi:hypothetical protein